MPTLQTLKKRIRMAQRFLFWHFARKPDTSGNSEAARIVRDLEKNSYAKIEGFADARAIQKEIDAFLEGKDIKGNRYTGAIDAYRIGKIEVPTYANHPLIREVANRFHGEQVSIDRTMYEVKTYGGKPESGPMEARKETTIFYHFDRPYGVFKTLLLLNDVDEKSGPFCIVKGSHKLSYGPLVPRLKAYARKTLGIKTAHNIPREREGAFFDQRDAVQCTGKAGDLYLVNTGAYHKGLELDPGNERRLLWNYCYNEATPFTLENVLLRR